MVDVGPGDPGERSDLIGCTVVALVVLVATLTVCWALGHVWGAWR